MNSQSESWVVDLGLVEYDRALELQLSALHARADDRVPDTLLLLQHPTVITLGRAADPAHLLATCDELAQRGILVREVGRGGDVTLHAPGQLVGYPIVDLRERGRDVHRYLRDLEEVLIRALAGWGIVAGREAEATGVWVGREKVAAIGIGVKRWTTYHGFALNVDVGLSLFDMIIPCGLRGRGVTSVSRLLGRTVPVEEAVSRVTAAWPTVFPAHLLQLSAQRWESAIRGSTSSAITTSRKTCTRVGSH
jgi:lipoate-protein ligase B